MKIRKEIDRFLVSLGFTMLVVSVIVSLRGHEIGVALFELGGLSLGIGAGLHAIRLIK